MTHHHSENQAQTQTYIFIIERLWAERMKIQRARKEQSTAQQPKCAQDVSLSSLSVCLFLFLSDDGAPAVPKTHIYIYRERERESDAEEGDDGVCDVMSERRERRKGTNERTNGRPDYDV